MEKRKETLTATKLCRFCLSQDETLRCLYDRSIEPRESVPLTLKILSCLSVEVFPSDKMPSHICSRCKFYMDLFYGFKNICRVADQSVLQYVRSGTALEPVCWPSSLFNVYRTGTKGTTNIGVVKTVEGGEVEITSQEMSDSEEGDGNVYSVKYEDGAEVGSASVKVISSNNHQEMLKQKPRTTNNKDFEGMMDHADEPGDVAVVDGCWACDECERTYPLQQLLELHKMQKHRERTMPCNQCDSKFFTKYDLSTHQLTHSDEMPFECVACDRQFKRHVLLKRHERLMHADLLQQKCPHCPATFLSREELEAHQQRHNREGTRMFPCFDCNKKFHDRPALQRHMDIVHPTRPGLACEYCPEHFTTVSKLTRHVRSHAGERAFPCKYCNKSFVKSHHYTRHLRLKHRDATGPFTGQDVYRCEQCDDTFDSQDDLIYHSAIHATQNLTCPLCQEKFENVDAVTSHIKSHVNGMEFQCDFCELVFTSKDKLDCHVTIKHEDEGRDLPELGIINESSIEVDPEEDEENNTINLKEEEDHMLVEITKADDFIITNPRARLEQKNEHVISEESESEVTYMDLPTGNTMAIIKKAEVLPAKLPVATITRTTKLQDTAIVHKKDNQTASILRKAEEIKRKVVQQQPSDVNSQDKSKTSNKAETSSSGGASDKSLRILEKELQELKRTNSRSDTTKTPSKTTESLRSSKRPQLHTSTPKTRFVFDERKSQPAPKSTIVEKKPPERRAVKENKEPKVTKEVKFTNVAKEDKEPKANSLREEKEREAKENDTSVTLVKNGAADKSSSDDSVRRSTRPSRVKDYAKMVQDRTQESDDDSDDDDDEEYMESEKNPEVRPKTRRSTPKPPPKIGKHTPAATTTPAARKRGRPRKEQLAEVPAKLKKAENDDEESKSEKVQISDESTSKEDLTEDKDDESKTNSDDNRTAVTGCNTTPTSESKMQPVLVSPSGQTLKKVPIKALPPGIKPLPLPTSARSIGPGELCEMQIGHKRVKVQKIVMTKAEVEAMTKKGLLEMKDGTMVLKQGIKIPTSDPNVIKSTLVGEIGESPSKKDKAAPTRCDLGNEEA